MTIQGRPPPPKPCPRHENAGAGMRHSGQKTSRECAPLLWKLLSILRVTRSFARAFLELLACNAAISSSSTPHATASSRKFQQKPSTKACSHSSQSSSKRSQTNSNAAFYVFCKGGIAAAELKRSRRANGRNLDMRWCNLMLLQTKFSSTLAQIMRSSGSGSGSHRA